MCLDQYILLLINNYFLNMMYGRVDLIEMKNYLLKLLLPAFQMWIWGKFTNFTWNQRSPYKGNKNRLQKWEGFFFHNLNRSIEWNVILMFFYLGSILSYSKKRYFSLTTLGKCVVFFSNFSFVFYFYFLTPFVIAFGLFSVYAFNWFHNNK